MYRVANASEYLAITGLGIRDIKLAKKAWVFPGQACTVLDLSPVNYTFEVQAMSTEKLPFILPAVFTIGPRVDDEESLLKYAKLLSSHDKLSNHVHELVQAIIEGETRVLVASMTMEDVFRGTKSFKEEVFEKVQLRLNQFGLLIYNANVKHRVYVSGHEYFSYLDQKTQAKIDVAEAKMKGEVGAKMREGQTVQNTAKINAETNITSTQRHGAGLKEEIKVRTEIRYLKMNMRLGWRKLILSLQRKKKLCGEVEKECSYGDRETKTSKTVYEQTLPLLAATRLDGNLSDKSS